nr:hypothetical protein [uncultured Mediterranean phage uvMED]|tara:strand:- start:3905 stop:5167 length:1263 start_codon:yes stop_codon:yes gene_type:complete
MGLLSSNFLRDVAIGAGEAYLDKRKTARDNIVEFQTRALKMKEELEKKYQESYDERKKVAEDFKYVATQVGESYLPQLNSFMNQGGELQQFNNMDTTAVKNVLDADRYKEKQEEFLPTLAEQNKLKAEDLNKQLQDRLGIFDNTASVFTKDIITKGMEGVRTDVGTIDAEKIDSRVSVGKGIQTSTTPTISDINKSKTTYENTKIVTKDDFNNETITNSATTDMIDDKKEQFKLAAQISGTSFNDDLLLNAAVSSIGNPTYSDDVTNIYNQSLSILSNEYATAKENNDTSQMAAVINQLNLLGFTSKSNELNTDLTNYQKEQGEKADTTQEEVVEQTTTEDVPGTKVERQGKSAKIVTEDYISPEQKDANSKVEITEDFIRQVMEKNDVDRNRAIEILQMYGYTQFPDKPQSQNKLPFKR